MTSSIRCEHLTKRFRRTIAIDDLQCEVPEGSIYALIGPNGAGKTTLIKMLMNILQPTSGSALLLNTDSRRLSPRQLARIGYVSENQELPEWMTVDYFLEYLKPFYPTWDEALAGNMIRQFELPRDRRLGQLSRGMKMKAALAASLAFHPQLILLDEPFSGLDPLVRDELIEGLLEQAAGTTIFVSSHDLTEIESFASHVGFMDAGRLQFSDETAHLANRFREVEITLSTTPAVFSVWPDSWSEPHTSPAMVRFVESRFDTNRTAEAISHFFPGAVHVSVRPMSLRDIFIAISRGRRRRSDSIATAV